VLNNKSNGRWVVLRASGWLALAAVIMTGCGVEVNREGASAPPGVVGQQGGPTTSTTSPATTTPPPADVEIKGDTGAPVNKVAANAIAQVRR